MDPEVVRTSVNIWNSIRGERAAWLKNTPNVDSFKKNLKTYLFCERFLGSCYYMFTILDYSSASEYSIIRRYTNIVYYYNMQMSLMSHLMKKSQLLFFRGR